MATRVTSRIIDLPPRTAVGVVAGVVEGVVAGVEAPDLMPLVSASAATCASSTSLRFASWMASSASFSAVCRRRVVNDSRNLNVEFHIDGLVQERCNFSAVAMELRLSCTNPSIRGLWYQKKSSRAWVSNYIQQNSVGYNHNNQTTDFFYQTTNLAIHENALANVLKMSTIFLRPQWVKIIYHVSVLLNPCGYWISHDRFRQWLVT